MSDVVVDPGGALIGEPFPAAGHDELIAYRYLLAVGGGTPAGLAGGTGWDRHRAERALAALRTVQLVTVGPQGHDDVWVAVHPEIARLRYVTPLSGALDTWQTQLDELRAGLDTLLTFCAAGDSDDRGRDPVVTVAGADDIADALGASAAACTGDVIAMPPLGPGTPAIVRDVITGGTGTLSADVRARVLLPHVSRYDADARAWVDEVAASGGEARTTASFLPVLVAFDRTEVFLLDGDGEHGHLVRHRTLVDVMVHMAESAWTTGEVYRQASGGSRIPERLTEEMKTAIARLLAAGYKDEVVAKRLGIAVRTCRKYIAEIFGDLGAQSRFQAGWIMRERALATGGDGVRAGDTARPAGDMTQAAVRGAG